MDKEQTELHSSLFKVVPTATNMNSAYYASYGVSHPYFGLMVLRTFIAVRLRLRILTFSIVFFINKSYEINLLRTLRTEKDYVKEEKKKKRRAREELKRSRS